MNIQVKGYGPKKPKICFIVGYPESEDVSKGHLLSSGYGLLLLDLLSSAGINKFDCHFTSVVKERPVNNDISNIIKIPDKPDKEVEVTELYREHESALYEELSRIDANVFVPVGDIALHALQRTLKSYARRGSILRGYAPAVKDCKVIPLVEPQSLMRDYLGKRVCIMDLERIKAQAEFPELRRVQRELITRPSYHGALEYLDRCEQVGRAGWDIEVDKRSREISCISFSYDKHSAISIPLIANGREYFSPPQEKEIWLKMANVLENPDIQKLAHNSIFDCGFTFAKTGIVTQNCDDTMVAMGIVTPDFPKTLHFCTSLFTDVPYYKDEGKWRIAGFGGSDDRFWEYNAKDSIVLHEIWDEAYTDLVSMGNQPSYERQMAMRDPMIYATAKGIKIDHANKHKEIESNLEYAKEIMDKVTAESNGAITMSRSYTQIKQYLYFDMNIKPVMKAGKMCTDEKALKKLTGRGYGIAGKILRARQYENRNSKYLNQPMSPDGRLRGSWNLIGAKTTRFSHSKDIHDEGFPMQTPPKAVREYMIADEGYFFMDIDLGQAESRIVAYLAPEPNMINAFVNGIDIHAQTGSMISGLPIEEVIRQDKEGICCDIGDGLHTWRYWGKKCNHAFNYGEGPHRFAEDCEISNKMGKFLRNRYHAVYPGINMFHSWVSNHLRQNAMTLINPYGLVRTFMDRPGDATTREAVNWYAQSAVAYKINEEGIRYAWDNPQWFSDFEVLNQMHDSMVPLVPLTAPRLKIADALMRLRDSLYQPMHWKGTEFQIPIGLDLGFNLMKGKDSKNEDGVYDKNPLGLRGIDFMKYGDAQSLMHDLNSTLGHLTELKNSMVHG